MKRLMVLSVVVAVALVLAFQSTASAHLFKHRACLSCTPAACAPVAACNAVVPVPAPAPVQALPAGVVCEKGVCAVCPLKKLAAAIKEKRCEKCQCEVCKCPKACAPVAPCKPVAKVPACAPASPKPAPVAVAPAPQPPKPTPAR